MATETYGNTKFKTETDKDGNIIPSTNSTDNTVIFDYVVDTDDIEKATKEKATLEFIKEKYIGGLYNIGLNYLKTPLESFYEFPANSNDDKPTVSTSFSNLSNVNVCIENMFTKYTYTYTDDKNNTVSSDYYPRIIPSHAQSIIFQITGTGSKASFKCNNNLTILNQTIVKDDVTTVEVPLFIKMEWDEDEDENGVKTYEVESYKYFNITSSNCTVKLLGYRV